MIQANHDFNLSESTDTLQLEYHQLQVAYYQLEDEKRLLERWLQRLKRQHRGLIVLILIIGLGIGSYFGLERGILAAPSTLTEVNGHLA